MARRQALVRKLPAVETLGSVTTICSDKTGTITEGVMRARLLWVPSGTLVSLGPLLPSPVTNTPQPAMGVVNQPLDTTALEALMPSAKASPIPATRASVLTQWLLTACSVCNNSTVRRAEDGSLTGLGDQTEVALQVAATACELSGLERLKRVSEIAFDSDRKRMSVVCEVVPPLSSGTAPSSRPNLPQEGCKVVLSKGAPEVVIQLCSYVMMADGDIQPMTDGMLCDIDSWCDSFSNQGLRTLAFALRFEGSLGEITDCFSEAVVEKDLVFIGLVALADPPRQGIEHSIAACHGAGIRVCMITGDHVKTAVSIARSIGILSQHGEDVKVGRNTEHQLVMNGSSLSSMTVEQLAALEPFPVVFSRVSPDNKLNIVKALQLRGDIVAMTGDGVNDAPAIRQADVGVAMGRSGTDITRQAADIILADDNFATIVMAVEEGRKIYDNIVKFLMYLLSCNFSEVSGEAGGNYVTVLMYPADNELVIYVCVHLSTHHRC